LFARALDAVDVANPFSGQNLAFTAETAAVFFLRRWHLDHCADAWFATIVRGQRPDQRLAINLVGLRPPPSAGCRNKSGIDDVPFSSVRLQHPMDSKTVGASFLDHNHRKVRPHPRSGFLLE
jgi:hypothetical protein